MNSFALDWYLRLKVNATLNNFYIYQLLTRAAIRQH